MFNISTILDIQCPHSQIVVSCINVTFTCSGRGSHNNVLWIKNLNSITDTYTSFFVEHKVTIIFLISSVTLISILLLFLFIFYQYKRYSQPQLVTHQELGYESELVNCHNNKSISHIYSHPIEVQDDQYRQPKEVTNQSLFSPLELVCITSHI